MGNAFSRWILIVALVAAAGCGGGGNDQAAAPPAVPPQSIVSGTVYAPAATLALLTPPGLFERFAALLVPNAAALVDGVVKVADGTRVELVRINSIGSIVGTLGSTTTVGGQYSFNLGMLGVAPASDLVVRAVNLSNNVELRAVATGGAVDVSPDSDAAVRLMLESLAATPNAQIANFTPNESGRLRDAVEFAAWDAGVRAGPTTAGTAAAIVGAAKDAGLAAVFDSAKTGGDSDVAPGDIGEYFPTAIGTKWVYEMTEKIDADPTRTWVNTIEVTGTTIRDGVTVTVLRESNSNGENKPRTRFVRKTALELIAHGDAEGEDQLGVYRLVRFPFKLGDRFVPYDKRDLDWGYDYDRDGKSERYDVRNETVVQAFTAARDPRQIAPVRAVQILSTDTGQIRFTSGSAPSLALKVTTTAKLARGVGVVEEISDFAASGGGSTFVSRTTQVLQSITVPPR